MSKTTEETRERWAMERAVRQRVADEIYQAIHERRAAAIEAKERGWPLLTEAMVIAREIGEA